MNGNPQNDDRSRGGLRSLGILAGAAMATVLSAWMDPGRPVEPPRERPNATGALRDAEASASGKHAAPLAGAAIRGMSTALERNNTARREIEAQRARTADRTSRMDRHLARLEGELDAALSRDAGKSWRIDQLRRELAASDASNSPELHAVAAWLGDRRALLTALLVDLDVDHKLPGFDVRPATGPGDVAGAGGPLETLNEGFVEPAGGRDPGPRALMQLARDLEGLEAAERLVTRLPLAAPLDYFHVTSPFGRRVDPLTGRRAIHSGLDMGAARGSKVLATAGGTVLRAGPAGAYGILVEIDHGEGIVTRYGHLSKALVKAGETVDLRTAVGIIGSTGRSTGIHLHYEVRIDDRARNPYRFLDAGRNPMAFLRG
ncbi:MAG: M23 family metallopeptidase [Geminicoccaceae bacterium]|nr:M23 family metallopeptidase [Geminicoccaceae bacterium]